MRLSKVNMSASDFKSAMDKRRETRIKNGWKNKDASKRAFEFMSILDKQMYTDVDVSLRDYGFDPMICRNVARERMFG